MGTVNKCYNGVCFEQIIRFAQDGDGGAVAYLLYDAKYLNYTFNYHLRKLAVKFFKYGAAGQFDDLISDLYVLMTKDDFHAIRSFNREKVKGEMAVKKMFFSWLMLTATRRFGAVWHKYYSHPDSDCTKVVVSVPAADCTLDGRSEEAMLREAISRLDNEEYRFVMEACLKDGDERKSKYVAQALTAWRASRGNMHAASESDINCIKSRAYVVLRPILAQMEFPRQMRKRVKAKQSTCGVKCCNN